MVGIRSRIDEYSRNKLVGPGKREGKLEKRQQEAIEDCSFSGAACAFPILAAWEEDFQKRRPSSMKTRIIVLLTSLAALILGGGAGWRW